jgi:mannose-6-phosphate isomerase-like protein (cupin superfamily)
VDAMSYTIKNLNDTKDSAPEFGLGEIGEAHFPRGELDCHTIGFAYLRLHPGRRQAFGHRHENAEELYVVLDGAGRIRLDDEIRDISRHDAIRVAPTVTRAFEAGDDGLTVLAVGPRHEGDGEVLQDFWKD